MRKTKSSARILLAAAAAILFCGAAIADSLELKNGQIIQGTYSGGSEDTVRFVVNGDIRVFHLDEIAAIHFGDWSPNQPPAAGAPQNLPPVQDQPRPQVPPVGDQGAPPANVPPPDQAPLPPNPPPQSQSQQDQQGAPIPPGTPPAPIAAGDQITVPADTAITIRMIDSVDSSVDRPGRRFKAALDQDLVMNGVVVAPKGTDVFGRLTYAKQSGQIQGRSELKLELSSIMINGRARPLSTGEYDVAGKSRGKQSAERIGGAAAAGAVIGGILGGGQGAAAGAAIGAGAGTAVQIYTHGEQVKVPSETKLEFKLAAPLITEPAQPAM